nr:hypothetical protein pPsy0462a_00065 [Pseudomonas syringae]
MSKDVMLCAAVRLSVFKDGLRQRVLKGPDGRDGCQPGAGFCRCRHCRHGQLGSCGRHVAEEICTDHRPVCRCDLRDRWANRGQEQEGQPADQNRRDYRVHPVRGMPGGCAGNHQALASAGRPDARGCGLSQPSCGDSVIAGLPFRGIAGGHGGR